MHFRGSDLRRHGWQPGQTLQIPDWCGCSTEYVPVLVGDGWWHMVPIWTRTGHLLHCVGGSPRFPTGPLTRDPPFNAAARP
jgi:hypothetical protein